MRDVKSAFKFDIMCRRHVFTLYLNPLKPKHVDSKCIFLIIIVIFNHFHVWSRRLHPSVGAKSTCSSSIVHLRLQRTAALKYSNFSRRNKDVPSLMQTSVFTRHPWLVCFPPPNKNIRIQLFYQSDQLITNVGVNIVTVRVNYHMVRVQQQEVMSFSQESCWLTLCLFVYEDTSNYWK